MIDHRKRREREREGPTFQRAVFSKLCCCCKERKMQYISSSFFSTIWAVVKIDRRECSNSNSRKIGTQHTIRLISSRGAAAVAAEEDSIDHWPL